MATSDKLLEEQLLHAGGILQHPSTDVDELLKVLNEVESYLSRVEQSPSESMKKALAPSVDSLVASELVKHSNVDVKVAVASCISEITRITAPDAPYNDDKMKEVFQLIVSSFENLSDESSLSYNKRTSILETVAKVRSCVVMLDLECDALIIEMFQHFLKDIRDYHPENVFVSMETIMTLVLEESEDVSIELLSPILASLKKDNEEVLPIARRLGEKVFENCALKIRPDLIQAVKSLKISLDDYSLVVANICQESSDAVERNDLNASGEHSVDEGKVVVAQSSDEAAQVAKEIATESASDGEVHPDADSSPKSVMSNGVTQTHDDNALVDLDSLKKTEPDDDIQQSKSSDASSKAELHDSPDAGNVVKSELKPEQTTMRRGKKPNSSMDATEPSLVTPPEPPLMTAMEPSDSSAVNHENEPDIHVDSGKNQNKEVRATSHEDPSVEIAVPLDSKNETNAHPSSPKTLESDSANVAAPSVSGSLPDESPPKKSRRSKKKECLVQEPTLSADIVSKKLSEGTIDSEAKAHTKSGKKTPAGVPNEDTAPSPVDASKEDPGTTSDQEAKFPRKVDTSNDNEQGSSKKLKEEQGSSKKLKEDQGSSKKLKEEKKPGRGKANLEDTKKSSTEDVEKKEMESSSKSTTKSAKGEGHLEETPRTNSKRKRTPGKEKVSDSVEYGEDLLGSTIKVWWPKDHMFYEGVVKSFDPIKKKHEVYYNDGDTEILNLKKQRWELLKKADAASDGEQGIDLPSPDASSDMHRKRKGKMNPGSSIKQGKRDASPKRSVGDSSSKAKSSVTKSGRKSKDDSKVDGKVKVESPKTVGKSEVDSSVKSKDHTPKGGSKSKDHSPKGGSKSKDHSPKGGSKSKDHVSKVAGKANNVEPDTPKDLKKSEQDTQKTAGKLKGKSIKSGSKSDANGTGKLKSGSSKVKETEDLKEKAPDSSKTPQNPKRKSSDSSKAQESETTTGRKRRRGGKS